MSELKANKQEMYSFVRSIWTRVEGTKDYINQVGWYAVFVHDARVWGEYRIYDAKGEFIDQSLLPRMINVG